MFSVFFKINEYNSIYLRRQMDMENILWISFFYLLLIFNLIAFLGANWIVRTNALNPTNPLFPKKGNRGFAF